MTDRAQSGDTEHTGPATVPGMGWYLYAVTAGTGGPGQFSPSGTGDLPVQVLEFGDLAAVVRPVSPEDFSPEVLSERASDPAWLEAMVRSHNDVIATIHAQQAVLPAKFGSVYRGIDDLRMALEEMRDPLMAQLQTLQGADEWAVHVYADRSAVQERVEAQDAELAALERDLAAARPGRAYFLQRKLADARGIAGERALNTLAQNAFDHLAACALAAQISAARRRTATVNREEILRAAFLVARDDSERFLQSAASLSSSEEGVEVETTGPWPPYSFAAIVEETSA
jgi:hypothetical protein